ncbi:MAG: hypothetical protein JSS37_02155 [Proteobacteria bacterium]|nr:hypothetical protein [Pseudomonadota bacterium]
MPQVIFADERMAAHGTKICRRMRQHIFTKLPPIAGDLANRYVKTAECSSFEQTNHELQNIYNPLRIENLNLCADSMCNDQLTRQPTMYLAKTLVIKAA